MAIKWYIQEALDPLASVTPLCSLVGIVAASLYASINVPNAILLLIAMLFTNIAVDTVNDYTDFKRGIDQEATRTKFSGGRAGLIARGKVDPKKALAVGIVSALIALAIGVRFMMAMPILIPFVAFGALVIFLYASHFVNVPYLAEVLLAVTFTLVPLGSFIAMTGSVAHLQSALAFSIPIGVIVGMVLLLNEIPDREVDRKHGRKSAAVMINSPKGIAYYYLVWQIAGALVLVAGAATGAIPITTLIALISLPLMFVAFKGAIHYKKAESFEKYMGIDVIYFFAFTLLLCAGLLL